MSSLDPQKVENMIEDLKRTLFGVHFQLVPKDGLLKFTVEDNPNTPDTVYVSMFSQILFDENIFSKGSVFSRRIVHPGPAPQTFYIQLPSQEFVKVAWNYPNSATFIDSTYITPNDTTYLSLSL